MAQNVYDRPEFFGGYVKLRRSVEGLAGAPEWPAMLPDMSGLQVADLGCGFGWFCAWAQGQGAARVLGIDISENMLARARENAGRASITYLRCDLAELDLPPASLDLVYSSLALHYVADAAQLFGVVHRALLPGGRFVFSTEHPIYMAPAAPGWMVDENGNKIWKLDSYFIEGPRSTDWLAKGVVKYHRTIGTTLALLIRAGFTIRHVEEFCPSAEQIASRPELAEERARPMFLLVSAER